MKNMHEKQLTHCTISLAPRLYILTTYMHMHLKNIEDITLSTSEEVKGFKRDRDFYSTVCCYNSLNEIYSFVS